MYSQLQICTKAHAEMVSRLNINCLSHVWPFSHTNSLENDQNAPFSLLEIGPISLLLGAFHMHSMHGSYNPAYSLQGLLKVDFLTSWHLKFEPFQNVQKIASFHTFENLVIFK